MQCIHASTAILFPCADAARHTRCCCCCCCCQGQPVPPRSIPPRAAHPPVQHIRSSHSPLQQERAPVLRVVRGNGANRPVQPVRFQNLGPDRWNAHSSSRRSKSTSCLRSRHGHDLLARGGPAEVIPTCTPATAAAAATASLASCCRRRCYCTCSSHRRRWSRRRECCLRLLPITSRRCA